MRPRRTKPDEYRVVPSVEARMRWVVVGLAMVTVASSCVRREMGRSTPVGRWDQPPEVTLAGEAAPPVVTLAAPSAEPTRAGAPPEAVREVQVVETRTAAAAPAGPGLLGVLALLADLHPLDARFSVTPLYEDAHVRVTAMLVHDALPPGGGETSVVLQMRGLAPPPRRQPLRVHLVVDASDSMRLAWPDVLDAANALVTRLHPEDELQIVAYGTQAREALAPDAVGDGSRARRAIAALRTEGRTHIEAGLRLAYGALRSGGRSLVLLVSDGVPQGGLSEPSEFGALAAEARTRAGATTLAIGLGNEFHTGILSTIALEGGGDFRIAPRSSELRGLLETELAARANIVATDLDIALRARPGVTIPPVQPVHVASLAAGEDATFVVPLRTSHAGTLVDVALDLVDIGGRPIHVESDRSVIEAPEAVMGGALITTLDQRLGQTLRGVARSIELGDGPAAASGLIEEAERLLRLLSTNREVPGAEALRRREGQLRAVAAELPARVAAASWGERRRVAASITEWAFAFPR